MGLARLVDRLSGVRYVAWYIAVLGLAGALIFTFLIFPRASGSLNLVLDPDHHGNLGFGILKYHSLSSYPDPALIVDRGPGYPGFIALMLAISGEWWPQSVQIGQCLLFAATCGLVFWIARTLWNRRVGLVASVLVAIYPLLIWYTSRIWVEALIIFLFTALVATVVYASRKPTVWSGALVGAVIAVSALCKTTFLVFLVLIPIAFLLLKPKRVPLQSVLSEFRNSVVLIPTMRM